MKAGAHRVSVGSHKCSACHPFNGCDFDFTFFSSWYKGSNAVLATYCLHLYFECIVCVYRRRCIFFSSEQLRTCARQPCAAAAPAPALAHPPTFLPSFRGELANKRQPPCLCCSGNGPPGGLDGGEHLDARSVSH